MLLSGAKVVSNDLGIRKIREIHQSIFTGASKFGLANSYPVSRWHILHNSRVGGNSAYYSSQMASAVRVLFNTASIWICPGLINIFFSMTHLVKLKYTARRLFYPQPVSRYFIPAVIKSMNGLDELSFIFKFPARKLLASAYLQL